MKKVIKTLIFIIVIVMLLPLIGCAGNNTTSTTTSPSAIGTTKSSPSAVATTTTVDKKVELRWFMWTGSPTEVTQWETLAKMVTEKYPNITVKFETETFANYWDKAQAQIATNTAPDIISLQAQRAGTFAQYN